MDLNLDPPRRDRLAALCRQYFVRRLDVFGSAARGTFDEVRSDVDVLVEFEPDANRAYVDTWFGLRDALQEFFGRSVDLVTVSAIRNPYFRKSMEKSRHTLYAA